jgi:preprotein translocase SecE subunit
MGSVVAYVRSVVAEAKKVRWTAVGSVRAGVVAVFILSAIVVSFVVAIDAALISLMGLLLGVQ